MTASFPTTRMDLVHAGVGGCDEALHELRDYVYRAYAAPLASYYRSTAWFRAYGSLADWTEEAVVHAFLAEKCLTARFWEGYTRSGMRLRRYLVNGLHFHLKELYRRWRKHRPNLGDPPEPACHPEPGHAADRLLVRAMVRRAVVETLTDLRDHGRPMHRRLFVGVSFRGLPAVTMAARLGVSQRQTSNAMRVCRVWFAARFRKILERDGVAPDRVEDELLAILEVLGRAGERG